MNKSFFLAALLCLFSVSIPSYGSTSNYEVCFTPGSNCTNLIVNTIKNAKKSLKVQAYSFTSAPIAQAVVDAKDRGVDVQVILDKSQFSAKYSSSKFLLNHNIKVWKDYKVAIAHNKVMIVDDEVVITGSFNFTKAAQDKNAENLLIIKDKTLAQQYVKNWYKRMTFSDLVPVS